MTLVFGATGSRAAHHARRSGARLARRRNRVGIKLKRSLEVLRQHAYRWPVPGNRRLGVRQVVAQCIERAERALARRLRLMRSELTQHGVLHEYVSPVRQLQARQQVARLFRLPRLLLL